MSNQAFVYTELQVSVPFDRAPWQELNPVLKQQPGLFNKTWLAGINNHSLGGFYTFDNIEHARQFVTGYFPDEARNFGVAQTTRIFDASQTEQASRDMNSVHYGSRPSRHPGAYLYTEVQINLAMAQVHWPEINTAMKQQPGLLSKTWLSGLHNNTVGGFYAFDSIENATAFALAFFPGEAAAMNAAYTTRIFDAGITEQASRDMQSPFYE
jgi:hypothetical protein